MISLASALKIRDGRLRSGYLDQAQRPLVGGAIIAEFRADVPGRGAEPRNQKVVCKEIPHKPMGNVPYSQIGCPIVFWGVEENFALPRAKNRSHN